ncbi:MAG: NADP-dependent phosphogluconate dehydrogenase [Planctomycetota bacterium]
MSAAFGVIGLGVMGRNLALNVMDRGYSVAVWNYEREWVDAFLAEHPDRPLTGTQSFGQLAAALTRPRRILIMIKAGKPVDMTLEGLVPHLGPGDVVIDGGNSDYHDTRRREAALKAQGVHFVGMGVSGGEEGARHGPSLMPGGEREAWDRAKDVLEAIAARTEHGPCVTHCGPDGAGHFVKMVHNGIEYGVMQLLAEAYDLLGRGLGLGAARQAELFAEWNRGPLGSFLVELTADVLKVQDPETGRPLVEVVLDKAGQKGTGRWTAQAALDLGVSVPTIAAALDGRGLSSLKAERLAAAPLLAGETTQVPAAEREALIPSVRDALQAATICSYAQGLALIRAASEEYSWGVDLRETARIWTGGCIIRARLLETIMESYAAEPGLANLLLAPKIRETLAAAQPGWRRAIVAAVSAGIPTPALSSSLAYFDAYRTPRLPQGLTQAQRDAFGAHTYEREDHPERGAIHTDWLGSAVQ